MKTFLKVILFILVFLAVSSGITKIMLLPQDVEFFGRYGFTNPILMTYGVVQLVGGILLAIPKTRKYGAATVALTFIISLIVLIMEGNILVSVITLVATAFLGIIFKESRNT